MIGAILGDIVGSPYEFDRSPKIKDFGPLFISESEYTDDSVMTIAVADGLMNAGIDADDETIKKNVIKSMKYWGRRYPDAGYGGKFIWWLMLEDENPYNSWGNGSAMRVSSVGWLYDTLERTREVARLTAEVTHNHPEGIKGAEATASAIFMARNKKSKPDPDELRTMEFDEHFDSISSISAELISERDGVEKVTISFDGERIIAERDDYGILEIPEDTPSFDDIGRADFLNELRYVHMGEWKDKYEVPAEFVVNDGYRWSVDVSYSDGTQTRHFEGDNIYPFSFRRFVDTMGFRTDPWE